MHYGTTCMVIYLPTPLQYTCTPGTEIVALLHLRHRDLESNHSFAFFRLPPGGDEWLLATSFVPGEPMMRRGQFWNDVGIYYAK